MQPQTSVLVVDDDPEIVEATAHVLTRAGYIVHTADCGQSGIAAAQAHKPDLVLLDVMLPDVSGTEVCRAIKQHPNLKHTFVVMASGKRVSPDDRSDGLDAGADGYLYRPVGSRELLSQMNAFSRIIRAEAALREAEKMKAVGLLAGGIAHELNSQLTVVLGYADKVAGQLNDPVLIRDICRIVKSATHAAVLVKELLSFAQKDMHFPKPTDMHLLIPKVAQLAAQGLRQQIRIKQALNACSSTIVCDPTQLQDALIQLSHNAIDAMPDGGELTFSTNVTALSESDLRDLREDVEPGEYLAISVTDTGVGISREVQKHMFEPFFTTKEIGEGPGLGLAAVHGIVLRHHGAIRVRSAEGQGSAFTVYLPLPKAMTTGNTINPARPAT